MAGATALALAGRAVVPAAQGRDSPRRRRPVRQTAGRNRRANAEQGQTLLRAVAALDDAYEAGKLDEETYQERRALLMERLLPLMGEDE
ncbi:MAG: hypothetical protein KatS3mg051_0163 [Anaerolineae bacterium]|nr:MAG: hypothetical protein KatS3mg051_0163 [Anaerolineae bacterium]